MKWKEACEVKPHKNSAELQAWLVIYRRLSNDDILPNCLSAAASKTLEVVRTMERPTARYRKTMTVEVVLKKKEAGWSLL